MMPSKFTFNLRKAFIMVLMIIISHQSFGQSPFFKQQKVFKNKKDYNTNVIFQDNTGYIWLGTSEGLVGFDGIEFKYFTTDDGLPNNHITAIRQDNEGVLWIGDRRGGISYYKDKVFY